MASILGGLVGAGAGFATGGPVGAALTGLAGLLGGGRQGQSAAQRAALARQVAIQKQLMQFANSAPGTSPDELQSLAQDRGLLGGQFRNQIGALANASPMGIQTGGMADLISNLQGQQTGNQMALSEQHMMDALARRREALLQAANVNAQTAQMAGAPGNQPQNQLGETLGQLGQAYAYGRQMKELQKQQQAKDEAAKRTKIAGAEATSGAGPTPTPGPNPSTQGAPLEPAPSGSLLPGESPGAVPIVGGGAMPPGYIGPPVPGGGGAFPGVGDDPAMFHSMMALHHMMQAHLHSMSAKSKGGGKRKKKSASGVGDAAYGDAPDPYMQMQAMMSGGAPMMGGNMPGTQGAGAPGNEPGGQQTIANQARQPQASMLDRLRLANGLRLPY